MPTLLLAVLSCADAAPLTTQPAPDFWDTWGDGRAELAGYRLTQPRYGTPRRGEAVLVFVTETFTAASRVKSDGGHRDTFPVLKLNEARDFQTGAYDYNTLTSAFVRLDGHDPLGIPTKVSFSAQEWCGHVYDQLITHSDHYARTSHSYFDGEADRDETLAIPRAAVFLDAMPVYARNLAGTLPNTRTPIQVHPRLLDLRFAHQDARYLDGTLQRSSPTAPVVVPAGTFTVDRVTVEAEGRTWTYDVERAAPHRLVRWTAPEGETGELTGSVRTPYWNRSAEGNETLRAQLGLGVPSWLVDATPDATSTTTSR